METNSRRKISSKGVVLDASMINCIALNEVNCITRKEEMTGLKRGHFHTRIMNIDLCTKPQVVNDPGFSSTIRFSLNGSSSFSVDNVSVIAERSS